MKKKKLRGYVLPTLYVIILMLIFGTVSLVSSLLEVSPNYLYATQILKDDNSMVVVETDGALSDSIIKPYTSEAVKIATPFYDIKGEEVEQQKALIKFQNTYLKNTGVLYNSEDEFDVVMVLDGTVLNIYEDEMLGKVVEIEHNTNLRTIYYSIDPSVQVGDVLNQGEVIGKASTNKISESKNNLLMEVYYNGTLINPEEFYNMDPSTLN